MNAGTPGEAPFPAELREALDAVPFTARRVWRDPRWYWALVKTGLDFVAHNVPQWHRVLLRLNPYPAPWQHVRVPVRDERDVLGAGADDAAEPPLLGGWFAEGRPGAPAVLIAPGTFQTKDDSARKARAIRLHRERGCHVLVVDLRGFGGSHAHLGSGGYVEAHDLHDAADWLRARTGASRALVMGDSLGGSSALIAAALPGARERFSGVVAWSPFTSLENQLQHATTHPGSLRDPFWVPYKLYRLMVYARSGGAARDFNELIALRAEELGLDTAELLRLSSPLTHVPDIRVPTVVYHAEDDPIVPVAEAHTLRGAATMNPLIHVRVFRDGGHAQFDHVCPDWFWSTMNALLDHLGDDASAWIGPAHAPHHDPGVGLA